MPTRSRAIPPAATRSPTRRCATRSCSCARIRPPTRPWPAAFTQQNAAALQAAHRPRADRRRALHRAFLRAGGAAKLINAAQDQSAGQCRRHVSRRGARQPLDLLRPARQGAQRRRCLCRAQPALSGRARQCDCRRRADGGRRQHAAPAASHGRRAPDTAGTTRPSRRLSATGRGRRRADVPLAVQQQRRVRGAVAPIVSELWSTPPRPAPRSGAGGIPTVTAQAVDAGRRRAARSLPGYAAGRAQPVQGHRPR